MPKILQFPTRRPELRVSPSEAVSIARDYLALPSSERSGVLNESLSNPDVFLALCSTLKAQRESNPAHVATEASALYEWLQSESRVGVFDEREYFLGEAALIAGGASRLLGKRDDAERWFDRAEAAYRHTINAAPLLATVAYSRLTLHYDRHSYQRVLELLPSLTASFKKFHMHADVMKCRFLEAMCLKDSNQTARARATLEEMRQDPTLDQTRLLKGLVLVHLGELLVEAGMPTEAVTVYSQAMELSSDQPMTVAHLKAAVGSAYRQEGRLAEAIGAFRASIREYADVGMQHAAAYIRIVLAETLIAASKHREAEWEILSALPTIEEQQMVPEGVAAVALLKESVRLRKTDPKALGDLRDYLKATF